MGEETSSLLCVTRPVPSDRPSVKWGLGRGVGGGGGVPSRLLRVTRVHVGGHWWARSAEREGWW